MRETNMFKLQMFNRLLGLRGSAPKASTGKPCRGEGASQPQNLTFMRDSPTRSLAPLHFASGRRRLCSPRCRNGFASVLSSLVIVLIAYSPALASSPWYGLLWYGQSLSVGAFG